MNLIIVLKLFASGIVVASFFGSLLLNARKASTTPARTEMNAVAFVIHAILFAATWTEVPVA